MNCDKKPIRLRRTGAKIRKVKRNLNPRCPICYERKPQKGTIVNCKHQFCLECIQQWYQKKQTCPICRRKFNVIIQENLQTGETKRKKLSLRNTLLNYLLPMFSFRLERLSFPVMEESQFLIQLSLEYERMRTANAQPNNL